MVKPELHANGSVKTNPNSLIRSSLKLSGIGARVSPHGANLLRGQSRGFPGHRCSNAVNRVVRLFSLRDSTQSLPAVCAPCTTHETLATCEGSHPLVWQQHLLDPVVVATDLGRDSTQACQRTLVSNPSRAPAPKLSHLFPCAGDVVANYRPTTHTLAIAFPASVRKFKAQHAVVLTGRYRLSGSKTAAFQSKPIRVC